MAFTVGMKVVCVDASSFSPGFQVPIKEGEIYTITNTRMGHSELLLRLKDVEESNFLTGEFYARRFRPVVSRKTDISIFTAMLKPSDLTVEAMRLSDFARELVK